MITKAGENKTFFQVYKKAIITAIITLVVAGAFPTSIYLHNAWGDDRYVQHSQALLAEIKQINLQVADINIEIAFADTLKVKAKWEAKRRNHENRKQEIETELGIRPRPQ